MFELLDTYFINNDSVVSDEYDFDDLGEDEDMGLAGHLADGYRNWEER